jgi:hypothetical protein
MIFRVLSLRVKDLYMHKTFYIPVSQTVMGRSALKTEALEDEYLTDKCIDRNQGPETDINPECLRAAMEAMFLDKYNVTVNYNEQVRSQWQR